jgi:hypothetical protein
MARENKQTRQERRFGKPERLADRIDFRGDRGPVVEASNVAEYYHDFMGRNQRLSFAEDRPCVVLPWPCCWIELYQKNLGCRVGWVLKNMDPEWMTVQGIGPGFLDDEDVSPLQYHPELAILGEMYLSTRRNPEKVWGPLVEVAVATNKKGELIANPCFKMDKKLEHSPIGIRFAQEALVPVLLAICFMHCKNTMLEVKEPDRQFNRERKKVGLKPFVRYHTINIEPMKRVLRTEGNIEMEGLKRAMHICRGHFATYSEEKPLFGRVAGTFWIPAHVRGSLHEGVVMSDYSVHGGPTP